MEICNNGVDCNLSEHHGCAIYLRGYAVSITFTDKNVGIHIDFGAANGIRIVAFFTKNNGELVKQIR
jgi:hypothetical protein